VTGPTFQVNVLPLADATVGYNKVSVACDHNDNIQGNDIYALCGDNKQGTPVQISNISANESEYSVSLSNTKQFQLGTYAVQADNSAEPAGDNGQGSCNALAENGSDATHVTIKAGKSSQKFCVMPLAGLARGEYNTDVKVTDFGTGMEKSATVSFKVLAPELQVSDEQVPTENLGYADMVPKSIDVTNIGSAQGYYHVSISNTDIFQLDTPDDQVASTSTDEKTTITAKSGLAAGTYATTVTLTYSAYPFTVPAAAGDSSTNFTDGNQDQVTDQKSIIDSLQPAGNATAEQVKSTVEQETAFVTFQVTTPNLQIAPIDFGTYNYPDNGAQSQKLAITNKGNGEADIKSVKSNNDNFQVMGGTRTIPAGQTDTSYLVKPKAGLDAGSYQGVITVTDEDGTESSAVVYYTVVKPQLAVAFPALGLTLEGYKPEEITPGPVVITDNSEDPANITSVTVDSPDFSVTPGDSSVASGQTDSSWKITPAAGLKAGDYDTMVTVQYNGGKVSGDVRFQVKTAGDMRKAIGSLSADEVKALVNADEATKAQLIADASNHVGDQAVAGGTHAGVDLGGWYFPWWLVVLILVLIAATLITLFVKARKNRLEKIAQGVLEDMNKSQE
jgi:methionine-rich copper-binding protein CopC